MFSNRGIFSIYFQINEYWVSMSVTILLIHIILLPTKFKINKVHCICALLDIRKRGFVYTIAGCVVDVKTANSNAKWIPASQTDNAQQWNFQQKHFSNVFRSSKERRSSAQEKNHKRHTSTKHMNVTDKSLCLWANTRCKTGRGNKIFYTTKNYNNTSIHI